MSRPTVAVIDDHELFAQGLIALLADRFEIVGHGARSSSAVDLAVALQPDLLILDVELADEPAERTIRIIRRQAPSVTIVVLTMFEDSVLRRQLLQAGASDYVTKAVDHDHLIRVLLNAIVAGPAFVPPSDDPPGPLSQRELEVLRLVAAANSNRDIATELNISEGTVKRHLANVFMKIEASSRIEAVSKAALYGLLTF